MFRPNTRFGRDRIQAQRRIEHNHPFPNLEFCAGYNFQTLSLKWGLI